MHRSTPTPTTGTPSTRPWCSASTARSRAATSSPARSRSPTRRTSPTTSAPSTRPATRTTPADIEGEWGPGAAGERYRFVVSGVFRLPWEFTIAPIFEYGSGQPWTHRLGYDYNGDVQLRPAGGRRAQRRGRSAVPPALPAHHQRLQARRGRAPRGDRRGVQPLQHGQLRRQLDRRRRVPQRTHDHQPGPPYVANPNYGKYSSTLPPARSSSG